MQLQHNQLKDKFIEKFSETMKAVLPILAIVLLLCFTIAPIPPSILMTFLVGATLLIIGMLFFNVGVELSMTPIGERTGTIMTKSKNLFIVIFVSFVMGFVITISEPDLQVLAQQVPSIPNMTLILAVALGVAIFLVFAILRMLLGIPLSYLLVFFYIIIFAMTPFVSRDFLSVAFDSGGVTTGPITVPFIMALGAGMASIRSDKHSGEDSFGLVALCSIGPILAVLILSIGFSPKPETTETILREYLTTKDAFLHFMHEIPEYGKEVMVAFLPIVGVFIVFQLFCRRFHMHQVIKISVGLIYTYIGLVLFLTGANVGFMPAGKLIGATIASGENKYWLILIGMVMGYFVVSAEPAVHTLKKQVEEITNGAISQGSIALALSIGVGVSVGIAMLRVLTGVPIYPFLIVGYAVSLVITFFVPAIYTGIALTPVELPVVL